MSLTQGFARNLGTLPSEALKVSVGSTHSSEDSRRKPEGAKGSTLNVIRKWTTEEKDL